MLGYHTLSFLVVVLVLVISFLFCFLNSFSKTFPLGFTVLDISFPRRDVWGWQLEEMFKVVPKKANNSVQIVPINLPSLSLMMLDEMPHSVTMCLKNSWAVSSAEHNLGVGMNVAYFKNWSMITKMTSYSPTFRRCAMKSRDTLFQGHYLIYI